MMPGAGARAATRVRLPFTSLHGYQPTWLSRDLVADLTVRTVLVPEALVQTSAKTCPQSSFTLTTVQPRSLARSKASSAPAT